jgi:hypothetical protein
MGLHAFGSETSGGRRYIYLLCGIMVYFALSTRRIPPERAGLFVGLFFLSGLLACISDLWQVLPGPLKYIYLFFPARATTLSEGSLVKSFRLDGAVPVAVAVFSYLQATYGIRGIFRSGKSWRWLLLVLAFGYAMFGGFRSGIIGITLPFVVQFFIEGLHRTKLLFIFAVAGILGTAALVPLAPHLPYTVQRALTFLPLNIDVGVRRDADASANWRFDMWKALLPQVPQHLLLGKGYSISRRDIDMLTGTDAAVNKTFAENDYFALSGTYHSGPFSVVMTFGIWGVITIIWFWIASIWVLYRNYRYGDPALRTVNTFLFSLFMVRVLLFLLLAGDFGSDMLYFGGWIGLSVALNGGVCHPAPAPAPAANKYPAFDNVRSHLQPTFRRPNARV